MSYDLRIWEHPAGQATPASLEEAARRGMELEQLAPGFNPKFAELAEQMVAYSGSANASWIGSPVANARNCSRAVWSFALPSENRVHLLCVVVKLANALGLTVWDDQLGLALIPPDVVLPPERASIWKSAMQAMEDEHRGRAQPLSSTLAAARDEMRSALTALLAPRGFISPRQPIHCPYYHAKAEATYFRSTAAGGQCVTLMTSEYEGVPCITIDVNVFSEEIAAIMRVVFPEHDEVYFRRQLSFYVGVSGELYARTAVRSSEDVQRMMEKVQDPVASILEMTRTPLGLHAVMSGTTAFTFPGNPLGPETLAEHAQEDFGFAALISFWLYGGDQFPAVAQRKRAREERVGGEVMKDELVQRLDRVLAYLQAHVPRKA